MLVELLCLVACQAVILWGFRQGLDLNVYDEAHHSRQGALMAEGRWRDVNYAFSPPLSGLYGLLHGLGVPPWRQPDLVTAGSALAATLALWWALRALLGPVAAFLAACWWAGSGVALRGANLDASTYVLGLALVALATGLVARGRWSAALAVLGVAALNRGEVALWLILAAVLWLVLGRRRAGAPPRRLGWAYAGVGLAFLLWSQVDWRHRGRFWLAFCQHFRWGHPEGRTVKEVFPGAASAADALRVDPEAFAAHVGRNLVALPRALAKLVLDAWDWVPGLNPVLVTLLLGLAALGALARALGRSPASSPLPPGTGPFLAGSLAVSVVGLILLPRPALLAPLLPAIQVALFGAAASGGRWVSGRVPALGRLAGALPVAAAVGVLVLGGPFAERPVLAAGATGPEGAARTPHRIAVELLRKHARPGTRLLAAQAQVLLDTAGIAAAQGISPTGLGFPEEYAELELRALAERLRPELLLDTPLLRSDPERNRQLEVLLREGGWRRVEERAGVALYARVP